MSGIYWGLTVMDLMSQLPRMNCEEITEFIKSCQHECGGISASIGHDPHLLYTLSAVQVRGLPLVKGRLKNDIFYVMSI